MNILVTGGAGFIGSHLCEALLKEGHRVLCLDNLYTGNLNNLSRAFNYNEKFRFAEADVNCFEELRKVFKSHKVDAVYHYAAVVGVKRTIEHPLAVLEDIKGIRNLLELSVKYGVKKFIYSSSSEVYGEPGKPVSSESDPLNPKLTYAVVKLSGEKYCEAYYRKKNLNTCCLRFFNVYGPRQNSSAYGFVIGILMENALNSNPAEIFGDGEQTRDFTYVEDAVAVSVRSLEKGTCGEIINVGTGIRTSINELAEKINSVIGTEVTPEHLPPRPGDIRHRCADISRMRKLLGFSPRYTLEEGLRKTLTWYRDSRC